MAERPLDHRNGSLLSAPVVLEAVGDILDPQSLSVDTATVTIEPYAGMAAGDLVALSWVGNTSGSSIADVVLISDSMVGTEVTVRFPKAFVRSSRGLVSLSYRVSRTDGTTAISEQLKLTVEEFAE